LQQQKNLMLQKNLMIPTKKNLSWIFSDHIIMSSLQKIRLLGSSFSLKVDEDPEYFNKIIKYIKQKISDVESSMSVKDPLRIALLSCILLTDDLLKEQDKKGHGLSSKVADEVEQMTLEIINLIDKSFTE
ncbi:MAG: cell division protein ZapA, partial [Spirochaetales bacterium]|nr:cell division protein ZapA [Spirochaetales bacterium]